MKRFYSTLLALLLFLAFALQINAGGGNANPAPMNKYTMKVIEHFPTDGSYPYWWPKGNIYDGATTDVIYQGERVMRGDPDNKCRSYCCGLTLQTFFLTLQEYEKAGNKLPPSQLVPETSSKFKHLWFCPALKSPGPVLALEEFGLGYRVENLDDAVPGDFIQIWRNHGSGHSVIFIDWERDDEGKITGLKYWSTQPATKGVGYRTEPVGDGKKDVTRDLIFVGRLNPPEEWKKPE
jgi:hypothetical protein